MVANIAAHIAGRVATWAVLGPATRLVYPFGAVRRVLRGPIRGTRFIVEPGIGATFAFGIDGGRTSVYGKYIRPGNVVFDLGANRGQSALYLSKVVGAHGKVVAFEPAMNPLLSLRRNLDLNGIKNVSVVHTAIADHVGTARFMYSDAKSTQGKLQAVEKTYTYRDAEIIDVPVTTLDAFTKSSRTLPDVVKIDVEGAAAAVLRGATDLIISKWPVFYVELHGPEEREGVRKELLARGYLATSIDGRSITADTMERYSSLILMPGGN